MGDPDKDDAMKLTLRDDDVELTFSVRFHYSEYSEEKKNGKYGKRRIVRCILEWKTSDGGWMTLSESTANCSPEDNYSKRYGRLLAFRRLLQKLKEPLSRFEMSIAEKFPNENVVVRFWEAFAASHRLPNDKKRTAKEEGVASSNDISDSVSEVSKTS